MFAFFEVYARYSQIAVFDPDSQSPFNDWTPQQVAQGFSWHPEGVSFATLDESGPVRVEARRVANVAIKSDAKRAILVPFRVGRSGRVEVAPIDRGKLVSIPSGRYALVFETGHASDGIMWCRFSFVPSDVDQVRILRADSALSRTLPLLMQT